MAKKYQPKKVTTLLFFTILAIVAYIIINTKFKEEVILEESTPALSVVYKSDIQVKKKEKPKLAIIVDDVSFQIHVKRIQDIGYPITMAFLPPTSKHKNSAKIAKNIPFYMIHLPLEARSFKFAEENTLIISDSYQTIEQRVQELHFLYPKATFTNNHTGSKFTANKEAMDKLMKALKKYNFTFVDSRTTAKSVAKQTASKYSVPFLSRNIFLDNKKEKAYIQQQLKKAIKVAKEDGSAIAICHPHKLTLQTLKDSKHLLKDVELVLVNQL
ncbi:MAG: divergent polysaccharide deacetylase family protein [Campylobacterales bacterium]|nr:divergent polysaccharide deacetylase family protein [Campylobacterales bacterium]